MSFRSCHVVDGSLESAEWLRWQPWRILAQAFGSFVTSRPSLGCNDWLEFVYIQNAAILQRHETTFGLRSRRHFEVLSLVLKSQPHSDSLASVLVSFRTEKQTHETEKNISLSLVFLYIVWISGYCTCRHVWGLWVSPNVQFSASTSRRMMIATRSKERMLLTSETNTELG